MTFPKVSFIIVNFNTCELLDKCVSGLIELYPNMEIIVSDNCSTDGSPQMIKEKYASLVKLIENEKNGGLSYGNNIGYVASDGNYIVYLGSDAYPTKQSIQELVDFMEHSPDIGISTPKLVLRDGTVDKDAHRSFPTPLTALTRFSGLDNLFPNSKVFGKYFLSYLDQNSRHEIDVCITHFMMVRRSAQEIVGKWDEDFFLYGEDIDFCYRMKNAGYKVMYLGDVQVLHYKGASVGRKSAIDLETASAMSLEVQNQVPKWQIKAMQLFVEKHYSTKYPKWFISFMFMGMSLLLLLRSKGK